MEDVRIAPGRIAAGGGRGNGIPGPPGGNGGRPEVHDESLRSILNDQALTSRKPGHRCTITWWRSTVVERS